MTDTTDLNPEDHPGANLFHFLSKAGLEMDDANALINAHARMVARINKWHHDRDPLLAGASDTGLRDRVRRAVCEAEGFAWDTDMLEPDEYGDVADAVLAVLPAAADRAAAPLPVVWTVWREDEPAYGHFATEDAAKQGTIDCWQEDEPSCPDYSWRQDGPRLELVVGGEHGGVYASRHRVYGGSAPEARAADAQPVQHAPGKAILCPGCRDKGRAVCMADEAQPAPAATEEPTP